MGPAHALSGALAGLGSKLLMAAQAGWKFARPAFFGSRLMLPFRLLCALSDALFRLERIVLMALVGVMAGLVVLNVVFRIFRQTLAWADELALLFMALSCFVGASIMLRARIDPAVRILHELTSPAFARLLSVGVSVLAALFGIILLWLCWRWFDLPGLWRAGFSIERFQLSTFNFIYTDKTSILGWPLFWFYLVMPWFGFSVTVHALTNLAEDLGLVARSSRVQDLQPSEG